MLGTRALASFGITALLSLGASAHAALMVDDFESYGAGVSITSGASKTWTKFGTAVTDQLYATSNSARLISGTRSASATATWSNAAKETSLRRSYATAQDFSAYGELEVKVKSMNATSSTTVQAIFSDGTNVWWSDNGVAITGSPQTLTFSLTDAAMGRAQGSAAIETVLGAVQTIGFRFLNQSFVGTTDTGSEMLVIDDVRLNVVPEPAALGLLATGGLLLARRRRQNV